MKLHHVGIFSTDLSRAIAAQERLGMTLYWRGQDPVQLAEIALLRFASGETMELIQPQGESAPSYKLFRKVGAGTYHFAYAVSSLQQAGEALRANGFRAAGEKFSAVAFGGAAAQFWYSMHLGLVELVEQDPPRA